MDSAFPNQCHLPPPRDAGRSPAGMPAFTSASPLPNYPRSAQFILRESPGESENVRFPLGIQTYFESLCELSLFHTPLSFPELLGPLSIDGPSRN